MCACACACVRDRFHSCWYFYIMYHAKGQTATRTIIIFGLCYTQPGVALGCHIQTTVLLNTSTNVLIVINGPCSRKLHFSFVHSFILFLCSIAYIWIITIHQRNRDLNLMVTNRMLCIYCICNMTQHASVILCMNKTLKLCT